jgi:hypothetical protein
MDQSYQCRFCGSKFHKESTLTTHMCVKKRRHADANLAGTRFGFRTFQKFYEITMNSKKPKTSQEFIDSPYYIDFVKFGNHLATLKPIYPDQFIEFVIMNSVKLKDWTKDFVYDTYIDDLVKKEPAATATDRTITCIMEWCEKNYIPFSDFFFSISANEAAYMIRTGRISPWVLYLCVSGDNLIGRFTEDHNPMIGSIIDAGFWMKKFKKSDDDVNYIKNLLEQAGI